VLRGSVPGKLMELVTASLELTLDPSKERGQDASEKRKRSSKAEGDERAARGGRGEDVERKIADRRKRANHNQSVSVDGEAKSKGSKRSVEEVSDASTPRRLKKSGDIRNVEGKASASEKDGERDECKKEPADKSSTVTARAVKSDDVDVPIHLWNDRVFAYPSLKRMEGIAKEKKEKALDQLRAWCHIIWKRKVERDFVEWFHNTEHRYDSREDIWVAGLQVCVYARRSDWWEWKVGSKIFFWRWPNRYREEARKRVPPYFIGEPPTSMDRQPPYTDEANRLKVKKKVMAVVKKGYIVRATPGAIRSLMFMFDVPKGSDDVRMVYDGSKSGLNDDLFAPWFALPTIKSMTRTLLPGYWCADNDYGKQFLNFELHDDLKPYCGVDLSQLLPEELTEVTRTILAAWSCNAMGLKPSPYGLVEGR
jgi:hypothetical protein